MDEIGEYTNVPVDAPYRSVELMKDLKKVAQEAVHARDTPAQVKQLQRKWAGQEG
jgi:hypothetical protein